MARFGKRILAPRDGITATRLRAPGGTQTHDAQDLPVPASIREWLRDSVIPAATAHEEVLDAEDLHLDYFTGPGELTDQNGRRASLDDAVIPGGFYVFHKPTPPEARVPFEISIVHEDDDLLIVDKPHFLASTPNGAFVRECVVTRLRVERGEDDLVAIHRLDRVTGGLLAVSRRTSTRGAYQVLFQQRGITKSYRALANLPEGWRPGDPLPLGLESGEPRERRTLLQKISGDRAVREIDGAPNTHTTIRLARTFPYQGRWVGEFELSPHTGKTHQLRVHMNGLGLPIFGDPVYPRDINPDPYDFSSTLQLLAERLEFDDPFTGTTRTFHTRMTLDPAAASPRSSSGSSSPMSARI
ncbi:pseudouridine synthase [Microbacterium amylolyticum]|uniref:RNA pseudouridylate synthase n=1 Tax=Microbacterium amylolyticum TaxID=936337 RepID=A0ABS4ZKA8_9MICO|nr:pseudouridine synthase [Microbacterium amylolyticum]MBP2437719.1 tRNA pseudouridine32 synthase/23S rRNA pseudouridine746 synthase [Microbacterium amylolyticum]